MLKINNNDTKDKQHKNQILNELLDNTLSIHILSDNGLPVSTITEENIVAESMTLKQSIVDEENFKFGGCIASEFDIQLIDGENKSFGENLVGKRILVTFSQEYPIDLYPDPELYPANDLFPARNIQTQTWRLFVGTIDSAKRDKESKYIHNIVAYDPIAQLYLSKTNVSNNLYKAMVNNKATTQELLQLCLNINDYQADDFEMYSVLQRRNYWWESEKKKNSNSIKITKGELLRNICEVNCGLGFFRPSEMAIESPNTNPSSWKVYQGKLRLLNSNDSIHGTEEYDFYESLITDEKFVSNFDGIIFPYAGVLEDRYKDSDWGNKTGIFDGKLVGVDDDPDESKNYYDISDNILAWDYSSNSNNSVGTQENLEKVVSLYRKLTDIAPKELDYMPITAVLDGRLWVEVGDTIIIKEPKTDLEGNFKYDSNGNQLFIDIKSRVLSRTLTGIKALTDTIEAKGVIL